MICTVYDTLTDKNYAGMTQIQMERKTVSEVKELGELGAVTQTDSL